MPAADLGMGDAQVASECRPTRATGHVTSMRCPSASTRSRSGTKPAGKCVCGLAFHGARGDDRAILGHGPISHKKGFSELREI